MLRARTGLFLSSFVLLVAGCAAPMEREQTLDESQDALTNGTIYTLKLSKMSGDTGNCVDVNANSPDNGGNVQEWDCNSSDAQKYVAEDMGSGFYRLRHNGTNECIQVDCPEQGPGCMVNGRNVSQWSCDGSNWKQWRFVSYNGYYQMQNRNNTGYCLDVQGGATFTANGTNIALWSCGAAGTTKGNQTVNPSSGGGASGIAGVVSSSQFNAWFPNKNSFYTYSGLTSINSKYPSFANSSNTTIRKREAAAFLANMALETGDLVYVVEQNTANYCSYCDWNQPYGCPAGQCAYYGKGPIQLSWNFNYKAAGDALGYDLLGHPDWVSSNANISWQTAAWYWNTQNGPGGDGGNCHNAMLNSDGSGGFGDTIRHINGSLECPSMNGGNTASRDTRINKYKYFCDQLGVSYGVDLSC
jgi:hypothetical protein